VDSPIFKDEFKEIPSESTTHGELPKEVTTRNASPIPNIIKPKIKTNMRCIAYGAAISPQVESARHGVFGMVLEGLSNLKALLNQLFGSCNSLTAKLYLIYF
jgi:hypothetical protein